MSALASGGNDDDASMRATSFSNCSNVILGRCTGVGLGRGAGFGLSVAGDCVSMTGSLQLSTGPRKLKVFGLSRQGGRRPVSLSAPDVAGAAPGEYEGSLNQL